MSEDLRQIGRRALIALAALFPCAALAAPGDVLFNDSFERGSLSPEMQARCAHVVRIPTRFCVNLGVAGAIVMYDRMLSMGRFAERAVAAGGPKAAAPQHVHGRPRLRKDGG